ncbi:hypothetical protein BJ742DRAFT_809845 [Cladochytrium replicatum]|nr:hypothetical protein BJ742DRAFT_809845 [Cladochytrium replicatum]
MADQRINFDRGMEHCFKLEVKLKRTEFFATSSSLECLHTGNLGRATAQCVPIPSQHSTSNKLHRTAAVCLTRRTLVDLVPESCNSLQLQGFDYFNTFFGPRLGPRIFKQPVVSRKPPAPPGPTSFPATAEATSSTAPQQTTCSTRSSSPKPTAASSSPTSSTASSAAPRLTSASPGATYPPSSARTAASCVPTRDSSKYRNERCRMWAMVQEGVH